PAVSLPVKPRMSRGLRARRSGTCLCSAMCAMPCAKARGLPPAGTAMSSSSGWLAWVWRGRRGPYAPAGAAAPVRVGLTAVKAARKTGRLGGAMAAWINRSLREVVDWTALKRAINSASIVEPAAAMRGAREAVRIEKAQELVRLVGDVGRV